MRSSHHLYRRRTLRGGYVDCLYYVRFVDWKGIKRVFPAGAELALAKALRDKLWAKNILREDLDQMERQKPLRFDEWLDDCLAAKAHKRVIRNYRMAAPKLKEYFGSMPISEIGAEHVEGFKKWRYAEKTCYGRPPKPATVNRHLSLLKLALRRAHELEKIPKVPIIRLEPENNRRDRVASPGELGRILSRMPDFARDVVFLLYDQGMRVGEAVGLKCENVRLEEGIIRLEAAQTKNGKPREIPMTAATRQIIIRAMARRVRNVNSSVFLDPFGKPLDRHRVYKYFRRACGKAKVNGLTLHDLRATFSTRKTVEEGWDRELVKAIMGDTTDKAFGRYVRPKLEDLRRVMDPWQGLT